MFAPGPLAAPMPAMPAIPAVKHTALPADEQAALAAPYDPFNKAQHEARMNQWLMATLDQQNANKIALYVRAYSDWQQNTERFRDLNRMDLCPPPPALPALVDVGPMPAGYWFGK